jgi:hypothetical protein
LEPLIVNGKTGDVPPGDGFVTVMLIGPTAAMLAAGTVAVSCQALTSVVASAIVCVGVIQLTVAPVTKLLPLSVSVKVGLPAVVLPGTSDVIAGTGVALPIVNVTGGEFSVPVKTVICAVPAVVKSPVGIAAVSCESLTKLVGTAVPSHSTFEPETKFDPCTIRLKPALPAGAELGDKDDIVGAGSAPLTVNVAAADVPPGAGLETVTFAVPAVAMSVFGTVAVRTDALTKTVGREAPFQLTVAVGRKPPPLTVS